MSYATCQPALLSVSCRGSCSHLQKDFVQVTYRMFHRLCNITEDMFQNLALHVSWYFSFRDMTKFSDISGNNSNLTKNCNVAAQNDNLILQMQCPMNWQFTRPRINTVVAPGDGGTASQF